jgi:hypothetical protein
MLLLEVIIRMLVLFKSKPKYAFGLLFFNSGEMTVKLRYSHSTL